jgi:nucleoside-triphosphatase THEP1
MQIGFVSETGRGASDAVLAKVVDLLAVQGLRLAGTVQANTERPDRAHCDMDVQVLPDGPSFRISQDLGAHAKGCRLDPGALEQAVMAVGARLEAAEVLVINKFGKLEAEGRGFCSLIAEALAREMTVLVGVNGLNRAAFEAFAGGMAVCVGNDPEAICRWVLAAQPTQARTQGVAAR